MSNVHRLGLALTGLALLAGCSAPAPTPAPPVPATSWQVSLDTCMPDGTRVVLVKADSSSQTATGTLTSGWATQQASPGKTVLIGAADSPTGDVSIGGITVPGGPSCVESDAQPSSVVSVLPSEGGR